MEGNISCTANYTITNYLKLLNGKVILKYIGLMKQRIKSKSKLINRFKSWCAARCHKYADTDPKKETDTKFAVVQMFCYWSTPEIFQGQTQLDQCGYWIFHFQRYRKASTGRTCIVFQQRYHRKTDRESGREEMREADDRRGGGR